MDLRLPVVFLLVATLGFSTISPVYAEKTTPSIGYYVSDIVYEIRSIVSFDPDKQAQLDNDYIESIQEKIDGRVADNRPIPAEYEERRLEVLTSLENAVSRIETNQPEQAKSNALTVLKAKLTDNINNFKALKDHNEIRTCVSDYIILTKMNDEFGLNKEKFASEIDQRCNDLPSARELCVSKFSTLSLSVSKEPYKELTQHCPTLKSIPYEKASSMFYGD